MKIFANFGRAGGEREKEGAVTVATTAKSEGERVVERERENESEISIERRTSKAERERRRGRETEGLREKRAKRVSAGGVMAGAEGGAATLWRLRRRDAPLMLAACTHAHIRIPLVPISRPSPPSDL